MALLARTVFVRLPGTSRDVILRAGEEPAPQYAALVTNPSAWEGGTLPVLEEESKEPEPKGDDTEDTKPAAKKATAAKKPARGRTTAAEGTGGQ